MNVSGVVMSFGQAVARATITPSMPDPNNFFFVQQGGTWKLNSWGTAGPTS